MKIQDIIMRCAAHMLPATQAEWGQAMQAEFAGITDERERLKFAVGCLQVSLIGAAQTRQGLSFIGRGLVAIGLASFSLYGLLFIATQFQTPQFTTLFTALCFYYAGAAGFTVLSLKGLRIYSSLGFAAAIIAWMILKLTKFETSDISNFYLQALSFEVSIMTGALIVAAIYLSLITSRDEAVL